MLSVSIKSCPLEVIIIDNGMTHVTNVDLPRLPSNVVGRFWGDCAATSLRSGACTTGILHALVDIIQLLDSDDYFVVGYIARAVSLFAPLILPHAPDTFNQLWLNAVSPIRECCLLACV